MKTGLFGHSVAPRPWLACASSIILGCLVPLTAEEEEGWTDEGCLDCHSYPDLTMEDADGNEISIFVDEEKFRKTAHGKVSCIECHKDLSLEHPDDEKPAERVDCAACHKEQSATYGTSVHGIALKAGDEWSARCTDCHGKHDIFPRGSTQSRIHYSNLAKTCGECHMQEAEDLALSVHGKAMVAGDRAAATCTDCHSEHNIRSLHGEGGSLATAEACSKCHESERINSRLQLTSNPVDSFFASYHGLATEGGSTTAANCSSCHAYHLILPSTDPQSTVHPANLVNTCGECHPGIGEKFVVGKIHTNGKETDIGTVANRWVRWIYLGLIVVTIGLLSLHNGIIWWRKAVAARLQRGETVVRMDLNQRFQHMVLALSFVVLAVTGFALKFPETWYAKLMGGEEIRRWIHRVSGLVLLGIGVYHIGYVLISRHGRRFLRDIWPRVKDARDLGTNAGHLVLGKPKARFGRFGYPEKIEYWAVVWGTIIMGVTGLAIWFKVDVTQWLPRWVIEVAITIHYYEAILACLAILVWHFYHVMFDPGVYPMNWAWLDGRMSKRQHKEEHPLEAGEAVAESGPAGDPPRS